MEKVNERIQKVDMVKKRKGMIRVDSCSEFIPRVNPINEMDDQVITPRIRMNCVRKITSMFFVSSSLFMVFLIFHG